MCVFVRRVCAYAYPRTLKGVCVCWITVGEWQGWLALCKPPTLIASLIMKKIGLDLQWTIKLHHAHYSILYPHMHIHTHIVRKYRTSSHKNKSNYSFIGMLSLTRSLTIKCPTSLSTVHITHTHTLWEPQYFKVQEQVHTCSLSKGGKFEKWYTTRTRLKHKCDQRANRNITHKIKNPKLIKKLGTLKLI